MFPSRGKRPNSFCAHRRNPAGEGDRSGAMFAHQPCRPLTLDTKPRVEPQLPWQSSPPRDLELCRGLREAPRSCKIPAAPISSAAAMPVGWCRGCSAFGIKGDGCCVWVRLPQPGDPAVNLFVFFLYRILLPKKEKKGRRKKKKEEKKKKAEAK